jgi:hypothetical protein
MNEDWKKDWQPYYKCYQCDIYEETTTLNDAFLKIVEHEKEHHKKKPVGSFGQVKKVFLTTP